MLRPLTGLGRRKSPLPPKPLSGEDRACRHASPLGGHWAGGEAQPLWEGGGSRGGREH